MDWNRYLNPDFTLHSKIAPPSRRHGNIRGRDRSRTLPRAEPDLRKLAYKFCRRTNEAETPASQTPTESRMSGRSPPQRVEQPTTHRRPSRHFTKNTHQVPLSLFTEGEDSNRDVLEAAASARGARTVPRATANMITSPRRDKNLSRDTILPLPRSGDYVEDSQTRSTDDVNEEEEIEYVGQASRRPRYLPSSILIV